MVDVMVVIPTATAVLGLWVLLTGRPFRQLPRWPFQGAALRMWGAYELAASLFVIALAMTGHDGLAFGAYAVLAVAFAAAGFVIPRIKASI